MAFEPGIPIAIAVLNAVAVAVPEPERGWWSERKRV
jgi:hypothetical protein